MATLNFPNTLGQPTDGSFTYIENNVIYSWNGTYWSANNATDLDNRYVNVTGDTMTGDLTLGTDKITLDAAIGSVTCAGVNATGGGQVFIDRSLPANNTSGSLVIENDDGTAILLRNNGDALFTGDVSAVNVEAIGDIQSTSQNGGQLAGFRNQVMNGDFRVWQRGTTGFTTSAYSADRWNSGVFTSTLKNTERAVVGGDVSALPESLVFALKTSVTSSGAVDSYVTLDQPIEGVRTYAGQEVTLSFYASADSALSMSSEAVQFFGKDPGVSTAVSSIGVQKHQLVANTWTRFSKTFTLPSVAGKVISNSDSLKVNFWFDAGSNLNSRTDSLGNQSGTFYITGVQLEPGPLATPFEYRPIATERQLCARYFRSYPVGDSAYSGMLEHHVLNASSASNVSAWQCSIGIKAEMRIDAPTVILGGGNTNITARAVTGGGIATSSSITCISAVKGLFYFNANNEANPSNVTQLRGNSNEGTLNLDAEL